MKDNKPLWGPGNPHPLSQMKTELVWEGKYDEFGNRREIDVAGLAMPMQKIETVDQPRSEAAAAEQLDAFEREMKGRRQDDFRNMLICGDKKLAMASLMREYKGQVDLICFDPPFDPGADFTLDANIGDGIETTTKDRSILDIAAHRDMWGKGTAFCTYMMDQRLALIKEFLSLNGSQNVHCNYHVNSALCQPEQLSSKMKRLTPANIS